LVSDTRRRGRAAPARNGNEIKKWQHPVEGCCHGSSKPEPRELSPNEVARLFDLLKSASPRLDRKGGASAPARVWLTKATPPQAHTSLSR
jgi:hypothetical protein